MTPDQTSLWVTSAILDGWTSPPVQPGFSRTIHREGFCASFYMYRDEAGNKGFTNLAIYGPDGPQILVPERYSWEAVQAALRICMYCFAEDVQTLRIAFAGRCCSKCLPSLRDRLEYPGWAD